MRHAKRFLIAGLALWLVSALVMSLWPADVAWYTNDERRTVARLLDESEAEAGPRIFLFGSSSVLFGYSAARIESVTGRPTRNLGIRSGRPVFDGEIAQVIQRLRAGDVVVVSDARWVDGMATPVSGACLDGKDLSSCPMRFRPLPELNILLRLALGAVGLSSRRDERDERGDFLFPAFMDGRAPEAKAAPAALDPAMPGIAARIVEAIRARGACPVLAVPPQLVRDGDIAQWRQVLQPIDRQTGAAMLDPAPFLLREKQYFSLDAEHVSAAGRAHVTEQLVGGMRAVAASCLAKA